MARKNTGETGQDTVGLNPETTGERNVMDITAETVSPDAIAPDSTGGQTIETTHAENATEGMDNDPMECLAVLADKRRVPGWQLSALQRFMNWTSDKHVSATDFDDALSSLQHRRIGGGRR